MINLISFKISGSKNGIYLEIATGSNSSDVETFVVIDGATTPVEESPDEHVIGNSEEPLSEIETGPLEVAPEEPEVIIPPIGCECG